MSGSIYKITCVPTGQIYIGQTSDTKTKLGKPYNYGPIGRWSDHVSSSRKSNTPLSQAIQQYGKEKFTIEILEKGTLDQLDELEAKWIQQLNSVVPHGLNVARHSRNKHHAITTLQNHFREITVSASLRPINRNGEYSLIYLYLTLKDGSCRRVTFGQDSNDNFESAKKKAIDFVQSLNCPWTEETYCREKRYSLDFKKLNEIQGKVLTKIRITTASELIAVYITTNETKKQTRFCFGGKNVSLEEAYLSALDFVKKLNPNPDIIKDCITRSPQQVAAE